MSERSEYQMDRYSNLPVKKDDKHFFNILHKKYSPELTGLNFFNKLLFTFNKAHCPECGYELEARTCKCKESERI